MRAFNWAETCEAVGNFLLYQLSKNYDKRGIGLYRDDGLAIKLKRKNLKRHNKGVKYPAFAMFYIICIHLLSVKWLYRIYLILLKAEIHGHFNMIILK